MGSLDALVEAVNNDYLRNPYTSEAHTKLVETLQSAPATPASFAARAKYEAITPDFVRLWRASIEASCLNDQLDAALHSMYTEVIRQVPIPSTVEQWFLTNPSLETAQAAYSMCLSDFARSQQLILRLIDYTIGQGDITQARDMYVARLEVPHKELAETYQRYSEFVSANFTSEYNVSMRKASSILQRTERAQRYYDMMESSIAEDPNDPARWIKYMVLVARYPDLKLARPEFLAVFYRSLYQDELICKVGDLLWLEVVVKAIELAEEAENMLESATQDIITNFRRMFPKHPIPILHLAWTCTELADFQKLRFHVHSLAIECTNVEFYRQLIAVQGYLFRQITLPSDEDMESLKRDVFNYTTRFKDLEVAQQGAKLLSTFSTDLTNDLRALRTQHPHSSAVFELLHFYFELKRDEDGWTQLFEDAMGSQSGFDNTELVQNLLRSHILNYPVTPLYINQKRLARLSKLGPEEEPNGDSLTLKPSAKLPLDNDMEVDEPTPTKKQKTEPASSGSKQNDAEPTRSREQFRVTVSPIPGNATKFQIEQFFEGYAQPVSINLLFEPTPLALVELASEQDVLTALTRTFKPFGDVKAEVTRIFGNTVWIANYPPTYNQSDIISMISNATGSSPILVRLPAQRDFETRRFCYVDFASSEIASDVRSKLADATIEGYRLRAEISNPMFRTHRAPDSSHQIYLRGLDFKQTGETSIRDFFLNFGIIREVKIPLSEENQNKNYINNGYAFVTFASEHSAKEAAELKSAKIDGRNVTVSKVKPKEAQKKTAESFIDDCTISLHNIKSEVTSEYLEGFLQDKIGLVARVLLKPSRRMALVEFKSSKVAGSAGVILEGVEFEGEKLHVGVKKDYFQEALATSVPRMVPPMLMRRRR